MLQAARASASCPSLLGSSLGPYQGKAKLDPHLARQGAADTKKWQNEQTITVSQPMQMGAEGACRYF